MRVLLVILPLTLVLLGPSVTPTHAGSGRDDETPTEQDAPSEDQARDVAYDQSVLTNASVDLATRTIAAERLIQMSQRGVAPATMAVADALQSGDSSTIRSVIDALQGQSEPAPQLLAALVQSLRLAPEDVLEPLAITITAYGTPGLDQVSRLALDPEVPASERMGAIRAMGAYPTRESGDRLLTLTNPHRGHPAEVRHAAFESLRRLFPNDFGDDHRVWARWWETAKQMSREEWLLEQRVNDRARIADLQTRLDALAQRCVELLRDQYRTLDVERQFTRLPGDLGDDLAPIRLFALNRISLLVRDSVPIPDEVRDQVVAALDDAQPNVRARAGQLLFELDDARLAALLGARVADERDSTVVIAYLEILANRPDPTAMPAILDRLGDESTAAAAAQALWPLTAPDAFDAVARATLVERVHQVHNERPTVPVTRLMARIAEGDELVALESHLAGEDRDVAAAVAEGFAARGHLEPLLAHASVDVVYPHALQALAEGDPTLESMQKLLELSPSEATASQWDDAVRTLAARLAPSLLLEADGLLAQTGQASDDLRETILLGAVMRDIEVRDRVEVLRRLVPMLTARGNHRRAYELLEDLNGEADVELRRARLFAALRLGLFEDAVAFESRPDAWLDALEVMATQDLATAERLREEISNRFGSGLEGATQDRFVGISARILERLAAEGRNATATP